MTARKKSRYAITIPNFFRSFSEFGHQNHSAAESRIPCGATTKTWSQSGQSEYLGIARSVTHVTGTGRNFTGNPTNQELTLGTHLNIGTVFNEAQYC